MPPKSAPLRVLAVLVYSSSHHLKLLGCNYMIIAVISRNSVMWLNKKAIYITHTDRKSSSDSIVFVLFAFFLQPLVSVMTSKTDQRSLEPVITIYQA